MSNYVVDTLVKSVDMNIPRLMASMRIVVTLTRNSQSTLGIECEHFQGDTRLLAFHYGDVLLKDNDGGYTLLLGLQDVGSIKDNRLTLDMRSTDKDTGVQKRAVMYCTKK